MEAGMLVQRLLLAASALGIGGHPLLGFDSNLADELYKLRINKVDQSNPNSNWSLSSSTLAKGKFAQLI